MNAIAAALRPGSGMDGAAAFAKALRDPRVVTAAKSLNIDLSDPRAFNALLERTRKLVEASTQVSLSGAAETAARPAADIPNAYARNAIRTYEVVSRLA